MPHSELIADQNKLIPVTKQRQTLIVTLLVMIWLGVVLWGMSFLWKYQSTPGEVSHIPVTWPTESRMKPHPQQLTLLMFAHPRCPCTRASLNELARIMVQGQERIDARALFFRPAQVPQEWEKTDLWETARMIPGVSVSHDLKGNEARKFGATTSGFVLLYNSDGQLLFQGGITAARGHAGDNTGKSAIESIIAGNQAAKQSTFVFGCALSAPENQYQREIQ